MPHPTFVFFRGLCKCYSATLLPEILVDPENKVVFLDQSAMFTCETVGGSLGWIVNETQRENHPDEIRRDLIVSEIVIDGGITACTLTIPARAEYNGTTVQCAVFTFDGSAQSENATMHIQGIALASLEIMVWVTGHELCVFKL